MVYSTWSIFTSMTSSLPSLPQERKQDAPFHTLLFHAKGKRYPIAIIYCPLLILTLFPHCMYILYRYTARSLLYNTSSLHSRAILTHTLTIQFPSPSRPHGLLNCSFLKNIKNPIGTAKFISSATQNHAFPSPGIAPAEKSGNTSPGPIRSGAVALATIVATEPRTCAAMSVKRTWNRVSVCRRIIPNPTPCTASNTPSHNHRLLPAMALMTGPPAQGTYWPILLVPHNICAHRGAPRPIEKTGRTQEWRVDRAAKT